MSISLYHLATSISEIAPAPALIIDDCKTCFRVLAPLLQPPKGAVTAVTGSITPAPTAPTNLATVFNAPGFVLASSANSEFFELTFS